MDNFKAIEDFLLTHKEALFEFNTDENFLAHYGTKRHSGRYPWGSGDNPYQHDRAFGTSGDFLSRISELKKKGLSEKEIVDAINEDLRKSGSDLALTTTQYRAALGIASSERRQQEVARAKELRNEGKSLNEIAKIMGYNSDSSIRSLLDPNSEIRMNQAQATAKILKKLIEEKGMIDVGAGVERELGISKEKLEQALYILEAEGYPVYGGRVPQATNPGKQTTLRVLCPPGTEHKEIYDYEKINTVTDYTSHDGGETFDRLVYPKSMDSSRLAIRYAEDGGVEKDGLVELRRGVTDLSLGDAHYAQVRILVDDTHYIKGMAVYSDDTDSWPDGVDVMFNTNKHKDKSKLEVLKPITNDPDNPFGSLIKAKGQYYYEDENGEKQLGLINKRAEEGDWGDWADTLPSQFLSKQNMQMINKQLGLASADKQAEFEEICELTNPTIKRRLLKSFADDCDAAAVHLKAAALPRQKYQVIIPVTSMGDDEIYAPNYNDGEKVALVRYPHGGTFEIPILTVNNKQSDARKTLGANAVDAVGINSKVAERLSGADFDGDTVMVIPTRGNGRNRNVNVTSTPPLAGLKDFDLKASYPERPGMQYMRNPKTGTDNTQNEMGKISNLITDMTLKGATQDELARAVRHSMVVIDAGKHKLDYKQSERDNGISELKKKYQGTVDEDGRYHEGSATLISRAKSKQQVEKRRGSPIVDKETGEQTWKLSGETYVDKKTGKVKTRMQDSTKMAETKDARTLSSGTPQEEAYATYANKMKALGNSARLEMVSTPRLEYSPSAAATYRQEVSSLKSKLATAELNAPRERKAQTLANATVKAKKQANPDMTKKEIKKVGQQALEDARNKVGAKRTTIEVTDREWEAIQAGAVSDTQLSKMLNHVDIDKLRERATPRATNNLSDAKIALIQARASSGYTNAEIAASLGVSASTVSKYLTGKAK